MHIKYFTGIVPLFATMLALPVISSAATPQTCKPGAATPASYKWNFRQEASQLLDNIQRESVKVRNHADTLQTFVLNPNIAWEGHAGELAPIKREINDMGQKLCRLEVIRGVVSPWEREAIDRAAPQIRLLADNAQDALVFLDDHQGEFWMPVYRKYVTNLYNESRQLSRAMANFEEYAKAHSQVVHLHNSLGLKAGS
jgi:hypothetical protein